MNGPNSLPSIKPDKSGFSRWVLASLIAAFMIVVTLIAAAPALFDQSKLQTRFLAEISRWVGGDLAARGPFQLTVFPQFKAILNDVVSTNASDPLQIKASSIEISVRTLPALLGRIESSEILIKEATVSVHAQADRNLADLWKRIPLGTAIAEAEQKVLSDMSSPDFSQIANSRLATVKLSNSNLTAIALDGSSEQITNVNGTLNWPRVRGSAAFDGTGEWRGETLSLNASVSDPLAFFAGGNSQLNLEIASLPMNFVFSGTGNLVANFYADGQLSWKTPSMRRFLQWIKAGSTAGESIGAIELNANLVTKEGKLLFNEAAISVSGSLANGALEVDPLAEPIKTSGTLAFKSVDLAALAASLPIGIGDQGAAELPLLDDLDLDLRLSAETAALAGYTITDAAGAIRIAKGDASIDLGTGVFAGGTVMGKLELSGPSLHKNGSLMAAINGLQQDQIEGAPADIPILNGPLNGKFEIEGPYTDLKALLSHGTGTFNLELESGVIRNFNLETMQASMDEQGSFELPSVYAGMSEAKAFSLQAKVGNGSIGISAANATVDGRRLFLSGTIPLFSQGIALNGIITDVEPNETTKPKAFFVGGTWWKPLVTTPLPQ